MPDILWPYVKILARVMMEVQFAGNGISMEDFNTTHYNLVNVNTTLSGTYSIAYISI